MSSYITIYNPEDMIWNLWQYILLISWTIEYLRNQIKLLPVRTQYLYMRIDIQCTINEMLHLFSYRQTKYFIATAIFTKTHKGNLFYALSFTCRKNQAFMMQQIFNKISHTRQRDINETQISSHEEQEDSAALALVWLLLRQERRPQGSVWRAGVSQTWEGRS